MEGLKRLGVYSILLSSTRLFLWRSSGLQGRLALSVRLCPIKGIISFGVSLPFILVDSCFSRYKDQKPVETQSAEEVEQISHNSPIAALGA